MKPYRPSNGGEGDWFYGRYCTRCWNENYTEETPDRGCKLIAASMAFEIGSPDYPKSWVMEDDGTNPRCLRFRDRDKPRPVKDVPGQEFMFGHVPTKQED